MQDLLTYTFVSFVACLAPGSGVLYTVTSGLRGGPKVLLASPLGTTIGVGGMTLISVTGLGALITSLPSLYTALQLVSAAVLVWLGWQSWNASATRLDQLGGEETQKDGLTFGEVFKGALVVQVSNVMTIVFLLSLMPQFITPEDDYIPRITTLSIILLGVCFVVHFGYSFIACRASRWLAGPRFSLWINRISGALFWLLAASVVWNTFR